MTRYAAKTTVTSDRSMAEIESTLRRYGAHKFMYGRDNERVMIAFEMNARRLRFVMPIPSESDFVHTPTGRTRRSQMIVSGQYEQAVRSRYRALLLSIKAKLESVESAIEEFEDAFMAQIVLPDGSTVGEQMKPQIEVAYRTGNMPPLLPAPSGVQYSQ
jgi:hypothetical protein